MTQAVTDTVTEAILIHPPHQYLCDPSSRHIDQETFRFQINQNQENPKSLLTNYHSLPRAPEYQKGAISLDQSDSTGALQCNNNVRSQKRCHQFRWFRMRSRKKVPSIQIREDRLEGRAQGLP